MATAIRDFYDWVAQGKIRFIVHHTYPLDQAAQAHQDISDRKTAGKVVLTIGQK